MKITVDNAKFFSFLLDQLSLWEKRQEEVRIRQENFDDAFKIIKQNKGVIGRFFAWFTNSTFEQTCKLVDPVHLHEIHGCEHTLRHIKELIAAFEYAIMAGLTRTTEIEYDSWIARQYMEAYATQR